MPTSTQTKRELVGKDVNYLRDASLVWPFVLSTIYAVLSAFSPANHQLAWRLFAVAIICLALAKERILLFFAGLGFVAMQCTIGFVIHKKWMLLIVAAVTGVPVLLADRYWRYPKFSYSLPSRFGVLDMLLAFASICTAMGIFWLVSPSS